MYLACLKPLLISLWSMQIRNCPDFFFVTTRLLIQLDGSVTGVMILLANSSNFVRSAARIGCGSLRDWCWTGWTSRFMTMWYLPSKQPIPVNTSVYFWLSTSLIDVVIDDSGSVVSELIVIRPMLLLIVVVSECYWRSRIINVVSLIDILHQLYTNPGVS